MKVGDVVPGTLRIGKDLKVYKKDEKGWKKLSHSKIEFPNAFHVIELFVANNNFDKLFDNKEPNFLKGQFSSEGVCQGARLDILPDGRKLDGAYSLFARNLTLHDQKTNSHWDVIYQNPNGKFAYHYTLDKKKNSVGKKFNRVSEFGKVYPVLEKKVFGDLEDKNDFMILPLITLLKTHMRIGNEIYFKLHGHRGLTTLKKKDIKIKKNFVSFKFIGKDGVPQEITKEFPEAYVLKLNSILTKIKNDDFVFLNKSGKLLTENDFKIAFKKYTGKEFYPHIVRSFYATKQTDDFLKSSKNPSKQEVKNFLFGVADELGHKKFSKKKGIWEDNYAVTVGHYIDPKLVEKLRKLM